MEALKHFLVLWLCGQQVWLFVEAMPQSNELESKRAGFPFKCSSEFVIYKDHCYRYFGKDVQKPFHHAQKLCSRHQSSLLSIHSFEEEVFVSELAKLNDSSIWLGLNDEDGPEDSHKEGIFKWSSGEKFKSGPSASYCNWKSGEPENRRHLDCVKMDTEGWAMAPGGCATTRLAFICKKKACHFGTKCLDSSATDMLHSPLQSSNLFTFLLLILLFGLGLVGGVCCYDKLQTRKRDTHKLYPT